MHDADRGDTEPVRDDRDASAVRDGVAVAVFVANADSQSVAFAHADASADELHVTARHDHHRPAARVRARHVAADRER